MHHTLLVAGFTVAFFISWMAFLSVVSAKGAATFFETLSVQEALEVEFNRPANKCFLNGERVSRDEWEEYQVEVFDSAYMMKIPGAKERLARMKAAGGGEGGE